MQNAHKRYIYEEQEKSYPFGIGEQVLFINNHKDKFGGFTFEGTSPAAKQKNCITLTGVPHDGHSLYIDVNHMNSFQLKLANPGNPHRYFTFNRGKEELVFDPNESAVMRSEPFSVTWDTQARSDIDVRVTVYITPVAEKHAIFVYFTTVPLSEALAEDEAKRVAGLNFFQRLAQKNNK